MYLTNPHAHHTSGRESADGVASGCCRGVNMAASSSGVEWSQLLKPILAASYGSVNKQDLPELVKAILKSKEEILHHEEQYEAFYVSLCVLAADYLASNAHQLTVGGVSQAVNAAKVLLQYLVSHVGSPPTNVTTPAPHSSPSSSPTTATTTSSSGGGGQAVPPPTSSSPATTPPATTSSTQTTTNGTTSTTTTSTTTTTTTGSASTTPAEGEKERMVCVHDKHLLAGIKALCRGSGALHRADQAALTAAMKASKLPPHIKTVAPGEKDSSSKEVRRGRSDPSAIILEQLISPIHDLGGSRPRPPHTSSTPAATDKDTDGPLASVSDSALDMRVGV
ncbi:cell wall integrity and stress response component 3-like isoform X2 [Portunus trituberculatus]|uniref:cell wall integrity and stress response component 3-like isoform X2 n=1 Tax=Portunus trituberculatus TaxID=210409 RepID=UPI001E1CD49E|nr:cell wall integrity and stress response component 3-like isoform X2 [Portunus trituberculatus]